MSDDETFFPYLAEESFSSSDDEEASSSIKKSKMEDTDGGDPKTVRLRVSIEETFEVELEKLTSKRKTMLGNMFTSNLAKPNESGEYEIKGINPVLMKDILNYYKKGEITKQNYIEDLKKTCDYLQIKLKKYKMEKSLYKLICEDLSMRQGLEDLYNKYIAPIKSKGTKKDLILHIVNGIYEDASDVITESIHCSVENYDHVVYLNRWSYEAIGKEFFTQFLSSKGIENYSMEDEEIDYVGKQFVKQYGKYGLKYKILKIHYEHKDLL